MNISHMKIRPSILLGLLGAILLILMLARSIFLLVTYTQTSAAYLPEEQTVALFEHVDRQSLEPYAHLFPLLFAAPESDTPYDLAILRLSPKSSEVGWVVFQKGSGPIVSSEAVTTLLQSQTPRLQAARAYAALSFEHASPHAFIQTHLLPDASVLLSPIAQHATHMAVAMTASGTTFALAPATSAELLSQITEHPLLRTRITEFLGSDVSLKHDLLPMLENGMSLTIERPLSSTGTSLLFALAGTARSSNTVRGKIDRLFESLRATVTSAEIVHYDLDSELRSTVIRSTQGTQTVETSHQHGWTVRTAGGILVAERGAEFLLSNDISLGMALLRRGIPENEIVLPVEFLESFVDLRLIPLLPQTRMLRITLDESAKKLLLTVSPIR